MRWGTLSVSALAALLLFGPRHALGYSNERRDAMAKLARETWQHAFNNYMLVAFPADELRPLSCRGQGADRVNVANWDINDVMGDYSLTLVDALSAFPMMGDRAGFETAVRDVIQHVSFDQDSRVQVFEITIRALGGLISGHLFATDRARGYELIWYDGQLLDLAHDLGRRLLPAFNTPTGIPIARVNLRRGVLAEETAETCSAGAGSLLLEFAALSRLTGEPIFEHVARKAFFAIWNRRSPLNLIGNGINAKSGDWTTPSASVGAGIDSIFEYMVKGFVLLDDDAFWRVWDQAYPAALQHIRAADGFAYRAVQMMTGASISPYVDSLSAFWPGLQVLAGDVDRAVKSHALFASIWERFSGLPELFNMARRDVEQGGWPLRPELIESTLFLHQATGDDAYLRFGERMLLDIVNRTRVPCGLAAIDDVRTGALSDRMHSFALSETLPYMYMLFDRHSPLRRDDSAAVFTTEGHLILPLPRAKQTAAEMALRRSRGSLERGTCRAYAPSADGADATHWTALALGVEHRIDAEFGRYLVGRELNAVEAMADGRWSPFGWCEVTPIENYAPGPTIATQVPMQSLEIVFTTPGVDEDASPSRAKLDRTPYGLIVRQVQGLRFSLSRESLGPDKPHYRITQVGPYRVASGAFVHISDPEFVASMIPAARQEMRKRGTADIDITFDGSHSLGLTKVHANSATFGPEALAVLQRHPSLVTIHGGDDPFACSPLNVTAAPGLDYAILIPRGGCTFVDKARIVRAAGFVAAIVSNDVDQQPFTPGGDAADDALSPSKAEPAALVLIARKHGDQLRAAMHRHAPLRIAQARSRVEDMAVIVNGLVLANAKLAPAT